MKAIFDDGNVSKVGIGTWQMGMKGWGNDYNEDELMNALSFAITNGVNFIDTAEIYGAGRSEELIGRALESVDRKKYFVATKIAGFNASKGGVRKSLSKSMNRLKVDYIDLYQVHWEPSAYTSMASLFKELEAVAREGLVEHIGVSNFSQEAIEKANNSMREFRIESNQIKFNLIQRPEIRILDFLGKSKIKVIAWSPLGQGFLSGKYTETRRPGGSVRRINNLFSGSNVARFTPLLSGLKLIADSRKASVVQIVLAYEKHLGVLPIPGFKNMKQVSEIIGATQMDLTDKELDLIDGNLNECGVIKNAVNFYPRFIPNFLAKIGALLI